MANVLLLWCWLLPWFQQSNRFTEFLRLRHDVSVELHGDASARSGAWRWSNDGAVSSGRAAAVGPETLDDTDEADWFL
jgi:hypothetical protein